MIQWNWIRLSEVMPMGEIGDHPHMPWNTHKLSHREDLTMDIIHLLGVGNDWNWYIISRNASTEDILNNPEFPWDKMAIIHRDKEVDMSRLLQADTLGDWPDWTYTIAMPIEVARREGSDRDMSYTYDIQP